MKTLTMTAGMVAAIIIAFESRAQDYPEASIEGATITLSVPYLEVEDAEGETKAYSADFIAANEGPELAFVLDDASVVEVPENAPEEIEGEGACSMTTDAQTNACEAGVKDGYFIALANCFNYSDPEVKADCMEDAVADREEGFEECEDIEEAHEQLCEVFGEDPYDPQVDPANFLSRNDIADNPNPFFPLVPGNEWVYESEDETITVTVLDETREILGVEAVVVRDVVAEDEELVEDTFDWYAQDINGNIWYMGELSRNYEDGELADIDGSWEAGVDGAKPGILIRGMPVVDEFLRQEYRIGEAEDVARTISLTADESTEEGFDCDGSCLETLEGTPLEPGVSEAKFYLPGTGPILTVDQQEETREELVSFTQGN
jgi:hypothetical protein